MDENTQNRALKDANNEARKCTAHARARCARAETCHRLAFGELTPLQQWLESFVTKIGLHVKWVENHCSGWYSMCLDCLLFGFNILIAKQIH